jgi:hypothetical protein
MKDKYLEIIKNSNIHRVDLNAAGEKNTRDYAYGRDHYSVNSELKAEIIFADRGQTMPVKVLIKDKTFNKIVAEFADTASVSELKHALDARVLYTRMEKSRKDAQGQGQVRVH